LQAVIIGASLGVVAFIIITIINILYVKRRRRLRAQQARRITIDPDGPLPGQVAETQVEQAPGTLTPFTVSLPLNTQLQPPLTGSSVPIPPMDSPHARDQERPKQSPTSTDPRASSPRQDTLVEMMHHFQERLLLLEGERVRDREIGRMSTGTSRNAEDTFETHSDMISDAPPTYVE
jgi:hypothetical protein